MSGASWADSADRVLREVFSALPRDASDDAVRAAVRDAYPFGQRAYWPYKAWLRRVKAWRHAWRMGLKQPAPAPRQSPTRQLRHDCATADLFTQEDP